MKTISTLLYYDSLAFRYWFKTQTVSKIFIALIFFIVGIGGSFLLYFFSKSFFLPLAAYQKYGLLTSSYLIHAGIVITIWFTFVSGSVSTYILFHSANKEINYLFSLPVKTSSITVWLFFKSFIINFILLILIFTPVAIAFANIFFHTLSLNFILRFILIIFSLALLINSLSGIVGYMATYFIREGNRLAGVFTLAILFAVVFLLLKLVFPQNLSLIGQASSIEFTNLYNNLPLNKGWLPTYWLVQLLTVGFSYVSLYPIVTILFLGAVSFLLQNYFFSDLFRVTNSRAYKKQIIYKRDLESKLFKHALIYKDLLSLIRVDSEMGYSIFLLSMVGFFYLFIGIILKFRSSELLWNNEITVFSFSWLLFFTTCFLLRLIFPLMSREGPNAWYIFTLPIKKINVLISKLSLGLIFDLPLILLSLILWSVVPLKNINREFLVIVSIEGIIFLTLVNVLLGSIYPNFSNGNDPEKTSTSLMGLVTLFVSLILILFFSYLVYWYITKSLTILVVISLTVVTGLLVFLLLFYLAKLSLKKYAF